MAGGIGGSDPRTVILGASLILLGRSGRAGFPFRLCRHVCGVLKNTDGVGARGFEIVGAMVGKGRVSGKLALGAESIQNRLYL